MATAHTNGKAHRAANRERKTQAREEQRAVSMGYDRGRYQEQLRLERHLPTTDTIVVDQGLEDDRKFLSARGWPGATHLEVRLHERAAVPQHVTAEVAHEIVRILNAYRPTHVKPEAHGGTARVLVPIPGWGCAFLWAYNKKFILRSWWPKGSEAGVPQPWPPEAVTQIQRVLEAAATAELRANPARPVMRQASTRSLRMHKVWRDFFAMNAKLFEAYPNLWVKGGGARDAFLTFYADKSGKGQERAPSAPRDIDLLLVGGDLQEKRDLENRFAKAGADVDIDIGSSSLRDYFQTRDVGVNEVALRPDQMLYTQKALNDAHRGGVFPTPYEYQGGDSLRSRVALRSALLAQREGLRLPPAHLVEPSLQEAGSFNLLVHLHKAYETGVEGGFFETIRHNELLAGATNADEALVTLTEATPRLVMTPAQLRRFNQAKHRIQWHDIDDDDAQVTRKRSRLRYNPHNVVYVGAMLDDPAVLLRWWSTHIDALLPVLYAHHMTIKFKPADHDLDTLPIGAPVGLRIVGAAGNDNIQAVVVEPIGVRSTNPIPHVTVATNGTPPSKSFELLAQGYTPVNGPIIRAHVGLFTGKEIVFVRNNPRHYPSRESAR
jgi:hypothetical protein